VSTACSSEIPEEVAALFWETQPESIDLDAHRDYVLERLMTRGGWTVMLWIRHRYSGAQIVDFLARKGHRLAPRERAYWNLLCGSETTVTRGGGRPPWAGP